MYLQCPGQNLISDHGTPSAQRSMAGFNLFQDVPARTLKEALDFDSGPARASAASPSTLWPDLAAAVNTTRDRNGFKEPDSGSSYALGQKQPAEEVKKSGPAKRAPTAAFSLADLAITRRQNGGHKVAKPPEARKATLSTKQLRKVQGLVKSYSTADKLAEAIRQKVQTSKPKTLSRLKRLILRERSAKAQQAAQQEVRQALDRLQAAQTAKDSMQASLKEAELRPAEHQADTSTVMQTQVLEMAVAEAERRCLAAQVALKDAEHRAAKAKEDSEKLAAPRNTGRPKILKSEMMGLRDTQKTGADHAQDRCNLPIRSNGVGHSPRSSEERSMDEAAVHSSHTEPASSDDDDLEGLENFEDTLASWMYEASKRNPQPSRPPSQNSAQRDNSSSFHLQEEEAVSSESGSSGPSLDGWEDVLEAWMGQTEATQPEATPAPLLSPERARREFMGPSGLSMPRNWPSRPQSAGLEQSTPQRQVSLQSQNSALSSLHNGSSPSAAMRNGYSADLRAPNSANVVDLFHQMSMGQTSSSQPLPLLADILNGGQVSTDAMLDLRARMPSDTMATQSGALDESNASYPSARTGGGGAAHPSSFPSRVSEIYAQLAQPNSSLPTDPHGLALLLKALEGNSYAQNPSPTPAVIPSLGNLDHLNLGSRLLTDAELLEVLKAIQSGTQPNFAANVDLFAHSADFHALADLGLPKLQEDPANVFAERLSYNVLNATQQKLLDNLAPSKSEWPGRSSQPPGASQVPRPQQKPMTANSSPSRKQDQRPPDGNGVLDRPILNGYHQGQQHPGIQQGWWPPQTMSPSPVPQNGFVHPPQAYFSGPMGPIPPNYQFGHPGNHPYFHQNAQTTNMPWMLPGNGMMPTGGNMLPPGGTLEPPVNGGMAHPALPSIPYFQMRHSAPVSPHPNFQGPPLPGFPQAISSPLPASPSDTHHGRTCEICDIVCCGEGNFQQHLTSKRHLRRAAQAGSQALNNRTPQPDEENVHQSDSVEVAHPTYMGVGAQCRNYCKQVITADLNKVVAEFLQQLLYWQERAKAMNPMKAKNKRLVSGLREVSKAVKFKKAKTIIVAPNIEQIETEGGLDDLLTNIMEQAEAADIPIIFALSRKKLGQVFGCRKKMSAIAILEYSGAEELFKRMAQYADEGRKEWLANRPQVEEGQDETTKENEPHQSSRQSDNADVDS